MKLIKQTGPYCLVASAAMILDTTIEQLHAEICSDGTEIWWPPTSMRGIHIQEIQDCCLRRSSCLYPIEMNPLLCPDHTGNFSPRECYSEDIRLPRFRNEVMLKRAILITENHAVAWDGSNVFDPKGFVKSFRDYTFYEAWILGTI